MSLRPPSTSPSPSPAPNENGKTIHARQSMGPAARGSALNLGSPRPGGPPNARPTSELLGSASVFQTPEAEALDKWFENLQNYEATLEEMAAASLDVNFKEELSAIEQWFKVLSDAERTAALYSLLQHSTQVQIRFFITVLQQMARSDPMTALLSPAMGGSMQTQMEAKLASMNLKSPGLKSTLPSSPTARNFNTSRIQQEAASTNFLSPDSANQDAAATLAQQRAKLKASNAAHRISAPVLASTTADNRSTWGPGSQLGQVVEQNAPPQEVVVNAPSSRPKSTEFSGSPRPGDNGMSATVVADNSWASMVNTPLIPMFQKDNNRQTGVVDPAPTSTTTATTTSGSPAQGPGVPRMGDPKIHRRTSKGNHDGGGGVYGDDGNLIASQNHQQGRGGTGLRNTPGGGGLSIPVGGWNGSNRTPILPNPNRLGGGVGNNSNNNNNDGGPMNLNGLGMAGGFIGSPTLGMGMPGLGSMTPMSPFNMSMLSAMGISPEAQLLAAQMAASGFGQPGWMGMQQPQSAGVLGGGGNNRRGGGGGGGPPSARSLAGGLKSASSVGSRGGGGLDSAGIKDEEFDPAILNDIGAWLRSLRLHKYTPNFDGMKWQEIVVLDEAALEAKGVAALGARRKMLKTFETVRKKMDIEGGPPMSAASAASTIMSAV